MKLWLLRPKEQGLESIGGPWQTWFDKALGFVVRAETEEDARRMANHDGGEEAREFPNAWLSPDFSTCTELTSSGNPGVVMRDFFH